MCMGPRWPFLQISIFKWHPDPTLLKPPTQDEEISDKAAEYARELPHNISALEYHSSPGWVASYIFHGNYVQVVGAVIPWISGPLASAIFAVDGKNETLVQVNNLTLGNGLLPLYTVDGLENGAHNLTINITQATPDSPFLLDYVAFATESNTTETPVARLPPAFAGSPPISVSSILPTSTSASSSSSSTASTTAQTSQPADVISSPRPVPLGPIVGAIVGGFVLLAAFIVLLYCLRRRSRKRDIPDMLEEPPIRVTPFVHGEPKVSLEIAGGSIYPSDDPSCIPRTTSNAPSALESVPTSLPPSWSPPGETQQRWASSTGVATARAPYRSSPDHHPDYPTVSSDLTTSPMAMRRDSPEMTGPAAHGAPRARAEKARYVPPTSSATASSSSGAGDSSRMLRGVLNRDGKEVRLAPAESTEAALLSPPSALDEGSSYDRASLPPPYVP
ncbi:hypothetical protein OH77DRAFT_814942 [Trametes cingulata]|nr:hypothetical protein OH77DRAFT_814942 [Trametes cingulata]